MKEKRSKFTKGVIIVLSIFLVLIILFLVILNHSKIAVGLLSDVKQSKQSIIEIDSSLTFLKSCKNIEPQMIRYSDILNNPKILDRLDILWIHRIDSSAFSEEEKNPVLLKLITNYVQKGGKLLLTMEAVKFLNTLKIEQNEFPTRYANATDDGYGRKLGLHSFRGHPVFDGLFGGAYIFNPTADKRCRQIGFFSDSIPSSGKVIGVDWAYINLKESSKLIIGYNYGKGEIIAIGAYIYFSDENRNRKHLEKFLCNTISYLYSPAIGKTPVTYWTYKPNQVLPFKSESPEIKIPSPVHWGIKDQPLSLKSPAGSNNYCEVAGQRMLVMGKEKGGIEEIWSHPFMALRDYEVGLQVTNSDSILWLNNLNPNVEIRPETFIRTYTLPDATLKEIIVADITNPAAVIHYEYKGNTSARIFIKLKTNMRQMWPYSERAFGNIYYNFDENLNALVWKDESGDFVTIVGSNKLPNKYSIGQFNDFKWNGSEMITQNSDTLLVQSYLQFGLDKESTMDMVVVSTNEKMKKAIKEYQKAIESPFNIFSDASNYYNNFLGNQLAITTPNNTFNEGYKWALIGTDRFFVNTPGIGKSLVAGYATTAHGWNGGHRVNGRPGYAWYFGRDAEWSSFALLGYGDFKKVKSVLETYQNFQDPNGKIYHELTTSGFPHYDAADATPLYIVLAGRYLKHSGDISFIKNSWQNIRKALDYCYSTDTDGDHLIENTNVGHGWVEGGWLYGAHTTLYLASCWDAALYEASYMANTIGLKADAEKYKKDAIIVQGIIDQGYWNPETNFFNYGKLKDNTFNPEITIMASIPMLFGLADSSKMLPVARRFARNGFTSDWGTRIVEESHRLFNPRGYHTGSVWPLYTGWTALAEYRYNYSSQGFIHLMNNLLNYRNFGLGYVDEVLNGLEYKPGGVCNHQCWSETMVLQPAIEGMLGFEPDAVNNSTSLSPSFPADWDSVRVTNLKTGSKKLSFSMLKEKNRTIYKLTNSGGKQIIYFKTSYPAGTIIKNTFINGKKTIPSVYDNSRTTTLSLEAPIWNELLIEIEHSGGIAVLPFVPEPKPYSTSEGFRVVDSWLNGNIFSIALEGKPQTSHLVNIFLPNGTISKVENGNLIPGKEKNIIRVDFEKSTQKYVEKIIHIIYNLD